MDNLAAQIAAAKKAGYSENEILQHISQDANLGPQIQQAIKSGYAAPDIIAHLMQPPSIGETALKYSAGSGPANLLDMPGRGIVAAANLATMGAGYLGNKLGILSPSQMPNTIDPNLLDVANPTFRKMGLINDQYAPDSAGGRIADFTIQALTGGGLNPAAIARNAARNMAKPIVRDVAATTASGLGAGGANAFTNNIDTGNDTLNNAIKIGGTFAGGALAGGTVAARGTAGDRAAAAINGVTPQQMALARELKRTAAPQSPITDYEAIQAVTGLNPKMQTQQRLAEQSDAAANTLTPMMQNRPGANRTMFDNAVNGISPLAQYPDSLAGALQNSAQKAINAMRKSGNNEAAPYYAASSNNPANKVPPNTWNMLTSDDGVTTALRAVKNDPYSGLQGAQEGSMQWLDQAKKHLDGQIEVAKRIGDNYAATQLGAAKDKIISAADTAFPAYNKARGIVANNMQENVLPMEQGQVGKLARSDDFKQQSEAFLPKDPADVNQAVVTRTANAIGEQNPDILQQFLAQDLRRKYDSATRDTLAGELPTAGAGFAKNVAGTDSQEANLMAAIQASGAPTAPFSDALSIFRAQGMRPPVNSATFSNADEASKAGGLLSALSSPTRAVPNFMNAWRNGLASEDIAKAISAQDASGPLRIEELARANGAFDPMKQQMLINALMAGQPNQ